MVKHFLYTVTMILFTLNLLAQKKHIDSLKLVLKNTHQDTTRIKILIKLGEKYQGFDLDSAKYFHKQALKIAETRKIEWRICQSLLNLGWDYHLLGNNDSAMVLYNKVLSITETSLLNNSTKDREKLRISLINCFNNIGVVYHDNGKYPKALEYYFKALEINTQDNIKRGQAGNFSNIGSVYSDMGNYPKALEFIYKAFKINEEIGNKQWQAINLDLLGGIHFYQGENQKALECFQKGYKINGDIGSKHGQATSLNNIGLIYDEARDYKTALEYHMKALQINEELNSLDGTATSFCNLAGVYSKQDSSQKALQYYFKSLDIFSELKDKDGIAVVLMNIGSIYNHQKKHKQAEIYLKEALLLSIELNSLDNIKEIHRNYSELYASSNKPTLALEHYKQYIVYRDSIFNEDNTKASIQHEIQFKYEKKATADSVKVAEEKKVVAIQLKQEKTQRFALYGGLILVILFAGFIFNRFRVTQKQKNIIELKEKETQLQKHIIEEKHKEITDSINYAERIQRSFLATRELLDENLTPTLSKGEGVEQNYFVLFQPKDVVSGDFYWAAKLNNSNFALVTADSTGHGVPGAIMSLLNVTSLEKAIEHYTNPADILNHTRQTIIERLKKDGSEEGGKDGMDCSLLAFDFANNQLHIAAANNPVWIIRNNELIEIKPDKMPVGKSDRQDVPFRLHTIELQKGDTIYTLTDGFPDQFGGPNGKKFMSKKLKELLLANVHLPIAQQKELLETTFKNWVGDLEQVDDVCLIGIKV